MAESSSGTPSAWPQRGRGAEIDIVTRIADTEVWTSLGAGLLTLFPCGVNLTRSRGGRGKARSS